MAKANALMKEKSGPHGVGSKERAANRRQMDLISTATHASRNCESALALREIESLTFNDLKKLLQTTDGNISVHARKLEDAQYIACAKSFEGRVPKTEYRLHRGGAACALERYLDHIWKP